VEIPYIRMIYKNILEYDGFKISSGKKIYHGCKIISEPKFKDIDISRIIIDTETTSKIYMYLFYKIDGIYDVRRVGFSKVYF